MSFCYLSYTSGPESPSSGVVGDCCSVNEERSTTVTAPTDGDIVVVPVDFIRPCFARKSLMLPLFIKRCNSLRSPVLSIKYRWLETSSNNWHSSVFIFQVTSVLVWFGLLWWWWFLDRFCYISLCYSVFFWDFSVTSGTNDCHTYSPNKTRH